MSFFEGYVVALDPGKDGGMVVLDPGNLNIIEKHPFPKIVKKPDLRGTCELLNTIDKVSSFVFIEEVHAKFGSSAKATFEFGAHFGFLLGILNQGGFRYDLVQPKVWQKKVWTTRDKVLQPGGKADPKPTSFLAAKRLFPNENFTPTKRTTKPHDGMVDAALIAYYGALKLKGG